MRQDINIAQLMQLALDQGRTTAQLGREIGLSQPAVSRLSRGLSNPPRSLTAFMKLIELLGGHVVLPASSAPQPAEVRDAA